MNEMINEHLPAARRPKILIIDDTVEVIKFLAGLLEDVAEIHFATSPDVGLKIAVQERPQVILLDVRMPTMDGYEVCRRLKANDITQDCSVLFVTAYSQCEQEVAAFEAGAVDFISKPLHPAIVKARVRTHLCLHQQKELLESLAKYDGLTGIYNRRYLDEKLAEEFRRHQRQAVAIAYALIDIDHFKEYNDGYGHLKGDECLQQVAHAIRDSTRRPGEIVARYGGEEVAILLPAMEVDQTQKYGAWICQRIRELSIVHKYSPVTDKLTVSVGIGVMVPIPGELASALVELADRALYHAKSTGKNRCEVEYLER